MDVQGKRRCWRCVEIGLWIGACACLATLPMLSLMPSQNLHRIGAGQPIDHFVAYAGTGLVMMLALRRPSLAPRIAAGLLLVGGGLELAQNFAPSRGPRLVDFLGSASGALAGVLAGVLLCRALTAAHNLHRDWT